MLQSISKNLFISVVLLKKTGSVVNTSLKALLPGKIGNDRARSGDERRLKGPVYPKKWFRIRNDPSRLAKSTMNRFTKLSHVGGLTLASE